MSHDPGSPPRDPAEVTRLLRSAREGDTAAGGELLPLVYGELRMLAGGYLRGERAGHTLQPTALVNEAWLRLVDTQGIVAGDREHFLALAARTMRRVLVDHARKKQARKRDGGGERVTLATHLGGANPEELDVVELNDLVDRLAELDERAARVVELRFFGGLGVDEIAAALGVSDRTVDNDWFFARGWLTRELADSEER